MPCIKPEDDMNPNDELVRIGRGIMLMYARLNIPLKDAETGENINTQHFTTNMEIANTIFRSSFLSNFTTEERSIFIRFARNGNRRFNNN